MSIPSDPLLDFAHQYLRDHPVCSDFIGHGPLSRIGAVSGQLLYREGPYQVEVFSVPPDYIVPAHTHPDVDSIEVYLSGSIKFSHSGSFVFQTEQTVRGPDDGSYAWRMLRIRPQDMHGAVTGTSAARFISIQHWLNGTPPTSVAYNYTGPAMEADHFTLVNGGEPLERHQDQLSEADAL